VADVMYFYVGPWLQRCKN